MVRETMGVDNKSPEKEDDKPIQDQEPNQALDPPFTGTPPQAALLSQHVQEAAAPGRLVDHLKRATVGHLFPLR